MPRPRKQKLVKNLVQNNIIDSLLNVLVDNEPSKTKTGGVLPTRLELHEWDRYVQLTQGIPRVPPGRYLSSSQQKLTC